MYASDLTNKKRAQVIYSDISKQKDLLDKGLIKRINYQKGGTDYSYMIELEQGCINNTCTGEAPLYFASGDSVTHMNIIGATYIDPVGLIEYGYQLPPDRDSSGNYIYPPGPTRDDVYFPIPMYGMQFYFFGVLQTQMFWSTNCAILFRNPLIRMQDIPGDINYLQTPGFTNIPFPPPPVVIIPPVPAILLGNYDRRLDNLYVRNDSVEGKYSIISIFVFFENYSSELISNPNTGEYQVRIIRELTGQQRQWIEVSVAVSPSTPGYNSTVRDASGNIMIDTDGNPVDPTKLSPYNITDGYEFINPCGTTFSDKSPAAGTSFTFESDSKGNSWIFRDHTYVPVP